MAENLYTLPANWQLSKLENVAEIFTGNSINEKIKQEKYFGKSEGLIYLATKDIGFDTNIDYDTKIKIPENDGFKIAPANTTLLCIEGGSAGRKVGFTNQSVCFVNKLCAFVTTEINSKLIFYFLQSQDFINQFNSKKHGLIGGVSIKNLSEIEIPIPPLDEQKRIVTLLDSLFENLDTAKEIAKAVIDSYELRRAAILHKAFTGELSEKWRVENGFSLDDWQEKNLGELLFPMESRRPTGETFRYIDIDAIDNRCQVVKAPKIIETAKAPSRASRAVDLGNVLFSMVRPYLKNIALIDDSLKDCIASTGFFVCRCRSDILPNFLYNFLRSLDTINYLLQFMKGDNSPSINQENFLGTPINLPPFSEQKEIARLLDSLLGKEQRTKEIAEKVLQQIDTLKKNILARAFRGELGTN